MGQTVIGGIIASSILTLVVVPVIYTYLDDFAAWLRRLWNGKGAATSPAGAAASPTAISGQQTGSATSPAREASAE
jgi:HAE1 family hydrophobic/amphiphilic exporter-1